MTRGLNTDERLLLTLAISSGTLTVPSYMANCHEDFDLSLWRSDKIYKVSMSGMTPSGKKDPDYVLKKFLQEASDRALGKVIVYARDSRGDVWDVMYSGTWSEQTTNFLTFTRKKHKRWGAMHPTSGRNTIDDARRKSDFAGRVMVSHNFVQFPADKNDAFAKTFASLKMDMVSPGRGVRIAKLADNQVLRAFVKKTLLQGWRQNM